MEDTCFAPLKFIVFSWQLLLYKIPTRVKLFKRKVITRNDSVKYVLCDQFDEEAATTTT